MLEDIGQLLPQLVINGIIAGSLYALAGVSWGIIFNTTDTFHYAHCLVFSLAGYVAVLSINAGFPLAVSFVFTMIAGALLGCAIEAWIYRKLRERGGQLFTIFLSSLGTATIGMTFLLLVFTATPRAISHPWKAPIEWGPVNLLKLDIIIVILSWGLIGLLIMLLKKSNYGKAIRAVGINRVMAEISGLSVNKIYLLVYAIGSALFGAHAFLYSAKFTATPFMGFTPFLYSFTAVFLGGVGTIPGAAIGGLVLGLAEQLGMVILPGEYKLLIAFSILFVVVLIRPQGLLGMSRRV